MDPQNSNLETPEQVQGQKNEAKSPFWKSKFFLLGILVIFLILSGAGIYTLGRNSVLKEMEPQLSIVPSPDEPHAPTATPRTGSDTLTDLGGNVVKFSSPTLGISFNLLKNDNGTSFYASRSGNLVCVTYDATDTTCQKGQSVEIFTKGASETLREAIEQQILKGYDPKDCYIKTEGFQATIAFPQVSTDTSPWWDSPTAQKCPAKYRETNGVRYFLSDNNAPTKFAFFNLGQYAIMGANDGKTDWAETFKFTQ